MNFFLAAWLTMCAGDATTTHIGLNRGAQETLVTQNPWVNDGIVAGAATGVAFGTHHLHRDHPKLAIGLLVTATVIRGFVVVNNARVLREQGRR